MADGTGKGQVGVVSRASGYLQGTSTGGPTVINTQHALPYLKRVSKARRARHHVVLNERISTESGLSWPSPQHHAGVQRNLKLLRLGASGG